MAQHKRVIELPKVTETKEVRQDVPNPRAYRPGNVKKTEYLSKVHPTSWFFSPRKNSPGCKYIYNWGKEEPQLPYELPTIVVEADDECWNKHVEEAGEENVTPEFHLGWHIAQMTVCRAGGFTVHKPSENSERAGALAVRSIRVVVKRHGCPNILLFTEKSPTDGYVTYAVVRGEPASQYSAFSTGCSGDVNCSAKLPEGFIGRFHRDGVASGWIPRPQPEEVGVFGQETPLVQMSTNNLTREQLDTLQQLGAQVSVHKHLGGMVVMPAQRARYLELGLNKIKRQDVHLPVQHVEPIVLTWEEKDYPADKPKGKFGNRVFVVINQCYLEDSLAGLEGFSREGSLPDNMPIIGLSFIKPNCAHLVQSRLGGTHMKPTLATYSEAVRAARKYGLRSDVSDSELPNPDAIALRKVRFVRAWLMIRKLLSSGMHSSAIQSWVNAGCRAQIQKVVSGDDPTNYGKDGCMNVYDSMPGIDMAPIHPRCCVVLATSPDASGQLHALNLGLPKEMSFMSMDSDELKQEAAHYGYLKNDGVKWAEGNL